mgnify:CR=1 FL=1
MEREAANLRQEGVPERFPVVIDGEKYYGKKSPDPQEGKIVYFKRTQLGGERKELNVFVLQKTIAGLRFVFTLGAYWDAYKLSFRTEEYEFARVDLDAHDRDVLFKTIRALVDSASEYEANLKEVIISSADASYTKDEIEECVTALSASPKKVGSREEILRNHKGFRIFDLYEAHFGRPFHPSSFRGHSKARARARLFKMEGKKYFPDWEVSKEYDLGSEFAVRRKEIGTQAAHG